MKTEKDSLTKPHRKYNSKILGVRPSGPDETIAETQNSVNSSDSNCDGVASTHALKPLSEAATKSSPSSSSGHLTRIISACSRCRARKTKCDQKFPSCSACLKAGVDCVGLDAATGREIPRRFVFFVSSCAKMLALTLGSSVMFLILKTE